MKRNQTFPGLICCHNLQNMKTWRSKALAGTCGEVTKAWNDGDWSLWGEKNGFDANISCGTDESFLCMTDVKNWFWCEVVFFFPSIPYRLLLVQGADCCSSKAGPPFCFPSFLWQQHAVKKEPPPPSKHTISQRWDCPKLSCHTAARSTVVQLITFLPTALGTRSELLCPKRTSSVWRRFPGSHFLTIVTLRCKNTESHQIFGLVCSLKV